MLFKYEAITKEGEKKEGSIDAVSENSAINALQKRGLIVSDIRMEGDNWVSHLQKSFFFGKVSNKDMVVVTRQISTLFDSHVSALRVFRLLAEENDNETLKIVLNEVANDIQDGKPMSEAFAKHPKVFSSFYVNMVRSGEESGNLTEAFSYLADYLERSYELISKAKHALTYPAFVIVVFFSVLILIFTLVIPKITGILTQSGQEIPAITRVVIVVSDFLVSYGLYLIVLFIMFVFGSIWWTRTPTGRSAFDSFKLTIPLIGSLYQKLYLARISDTLNTLIASGVSMTRSLEVSANVVDNEIYRNVMLDVSQSVKDGLPVSEAFAKHGEVPNMMVQMIRVSEEGGAVGSVLGTLAIFYNKEVTSTVDTLMDLIEPVLMVVLGIFVGLLLVSVLVPIYNIASGTAF